MSRDRDLQTNAADPQQLRHAERVTKEARRRELAVWRQQLSTVDGREFVWMVLGKLGIFQSGVHLTRDQLFALAGRQNVGLELWQLLTTQFPRQFLEMQGESMARTERQAAENQAARTPRATQENQ